MRPGRWRNCGRSLLAGETQRLIRLIKVEGRKGTTLSGAVLFRMATNVVLTTISNIRATAQAARVLHDFGLPAIIPEDEMPGLTSPGVNFFRVKSCKSNQKLRHPGD